MAASRGQRIAGWVLSGAVAAMLGFSASFKFRDFPGKAEAFDHIGYAFHTMRRIGVVEVLVAVLFLVPRTAFLGAILVTGYMGGVVASHVRVGDPIAMPVLLGVVAWVGYALRRPEVVKKAFGVG